MDLLLGKTISLQEIIKQKRKKMNWPCINDSLQPSLNEQQNKDRIKRTENCNISS